MLNYIVANADDHDAVANDDIHANANAHSHAYRRLYCGMLMRHAKVYAMQYFDMLCYADANSNAETLMLMPMRILMPVPTYEC